MPHEAKNKFLESINKTCAGISSALLLDMLMVSSLLIEPLSHKPHGLIVVYCCYFARDLLT